MNAGNDHLPRLSVVMAAYNSAQYIREAIDSILCQTLLDFELIVIDDGSSDGSADILDSYIHQDRRLAVYRQPNAGLIESLNRACGLARGAYIARMDADDISLPRRFEKQVDYLDKHPDVGVVGSWMQDIDADGRLGPIWPLPTSPATIPWFLMFGECMAHPSVMMRREVIQRLGYRADARFVEDYDLWVRATAVTQLANIPEVLLKYRVLGQSISGRNSLIQRQQAVKLQSRLRKEFLPVNGDVEAVTAGFLLDLYSAYRRRYSPAPGDDSEIALDMLRRLYLAGELRTPWRRFLPLFPKLFSGEAARKTLLYALSYIGNIPHGFTTQRRT